ncbi:MAG: type VI secretion system baseplate subunit TssG, partial [Bacteroidota bacterium]
YFESFWDLELVGIPEDQECYLLYVLTLSFTYLGNLEKVGMIMGAVLKSPVSLDVGWGMETEIPESLASRLGTSFLGLDTVLGGTLDDGLPHLKLSIGPVRGAELPDYLEGGPQWRLLEILERYFLPAGQQISRNFILAENESLFTLSSASHQGRLSYTTALPLAD